MKWRNALGKKEDYASLRKLWESRVTKKFAWFPTAIRGDTIWLQTYYVYEEWSKTSQDWIYVKKSLHDGTY